MSPTSTLPYEILFELVNNTLDKVSMRALRQENGSQAGATIHMHHEENVSLVLTAGSPYHYAVRQHGTEANIRVKVWQDTQCNISDVLKALKSASPEAATVADGVTVMRPMKS
ncbi:hypothetical protein BKA93DRAFT_784712 [Sparassis latifolia]